MDRLASVFSNTPGTDERSALLNLVSGRSRLFQSLATLSAVALMMVACGASSITGT